MREKLSCKFYNEDRGVHKFADGIWQILYPSSFAACLFASQCVGPLDIIVVVVVSPLVNLERSIYEAGKYWYSSCNAQRY